MERFNYPNLDAVKAESAEILYLMECASYGRQRDDEEEMERHKEEAELARKEASNAG